MARHQLALDTQSDLAMPPSDDDAHGSEVVGGESKRLPITRSAKSGTAEVVGRRSFATRTATAHPRHRHAVLSHRA